MAISANAVQPIREKRDTEAMKQALNGRDRLMFVMGVSLGLRIGDLLALRIGDLRGKTHITVKEQKTKKQRYIKLSDNVMKEIAKLDGDSTEYVFKSRQGENKPISRVQAYRILNSAAERAGIADKIGAIGTHTLRKTFGYQLYQKGVDITRLMEILSHSTPTMTLNYIGITRDEIDAAYDAIDI
jgi:integrase